MDSNSDTPLNPITIPDPSSREQLISTAVKFLQNPRVRPTTLSQKKRFLLQKGLTEEEVEIACQNAGAYDDSNNNSLAIKGSEDSRISLWIKAKDVANLVALISIGSYSLYSFWKRYLAPTFFGRRSRTEQNYEKLLNSILKLNENIVELKDLYIKSMQGNDFKSRNQTELAEVKSELSAIKSLLLSQSQFPSSPGMHRGNTSSIPSWQMLEGAGSMDEGTSRGNSEENSPPSGGGSETGEKSSRKRKSKSVDSSSRKVSTEEFVNVNKEEGDEGTMSALRKHPSLDSNNGLHSGSSCEVVFMGGKNDSDPDHSDD